MGEELLSVFRPGRGRRAFAWSSPLLIAAVLLSWPTFTSAATGAPATSAHAPAERPGAGESASAPADTVREIEIRSDSEIDDMRALERLLTVEVGRPLDVAEVRDSIRNLSASAAAGEVAAFSQPMAGGVRLIFALWRRVEVDRVELEGPLHFDRSTLLRLVPQKVGAPLLSGGVVRGSYQLEDFYHRHGYFEAQVRVRVEVDEGRKRAQVVYKVDSGPQATLGKVEIKGALGPLEESELVAVLKLRPGRAFRPQSVNRGQDRLRRWLIHHDYRLATVGEPRSVYDRARHEVNVEYPVKVGPRLVVAVSGADRATLERKGLLPFLGEEGYDEALLLQAVDKIKTYFQESGHYRVKVETTEERVGDRLLLTVMIDPGAIYTLDQIEFVGNHNVSKEQLTQLMTTSTRRLLTPGSGRLVTSVLNDDLDNIRSFYALRGYAHVKVGPVRVASAGSRLTVTIPIREGPQWRMVNLKIEGVHALDLATLRRGLPLQPGGPYHPQLLEQTLDDLRARYAESGHRSAQVSATTSWNDEHTLVDVTIHVFEGPQTVVDRVILRGNERTKDEVVERAIDLKPGEPVSPRRLLEVQRRLYRLGVFSSVQVRLLPGTPESAGRDVLVEVQEGKNRKILYGLGYDSEYGVRGLIGFSATNLFGRAMSAQVDWRESQRDRQVRALFHQPSLGRIPIPVTYSLFRVQQNEQSFVSLRRGTQVEAYRLFGANIRVGLLYNYRIVDVSNLDPSLAEIQISRDLRRDQISSVTPNLLIDHRDDPLNPTRGWTTNLQLEYAFPLLSADANFLKLFAQQTAYVPLGSAGVLAASLRLGAIEPLPRATLVDSTVPAGLPSSRIFIAERFFAGGRTTQRAYTLDGLGIPGQTLKLAYNPADPTAPPRIVPIGGDGLLLVNLDYRFPIAGPVGGTLFVDSGNVWADWRSINPGELKTGVGIGLRYLSPIGPLRLDAGWKLHRLRGESGYEVFLSFGNPF